MFIFIYLPKSGGEKGGCFDITQGPPSAVDVTKTCVSHSTSLAAASNISHSVSTVDLKLKVENTDTVKIGIEVTPAAAASSASDRHGPGTTSKEEKTRKLLWNCQNYVQEMFCIGSYHNSRYYMWHCFCSFYDGNTKFSHTYCAKSEGLSDILD